MHDHATRPRRGRRIATAILLPVHGMGLLTAWSGSGDPTCAGLKKLTTKADRMQNELHDAKLHGDDIAKAIHSFREQGEDFVQLGDDFSDLAETTEGDELVDALYEAEYVYGETGEDLLYAADIDANDLDRDEYDDFYEDISGVQDELSEMISDEDYREAVGYIDQTCGTKFR